MNLLRRLSFSAIILGVLTSAFGGQPAAQKNDKPAVMLTDKASSEWSIKMLERGAKILSDRDYLFAGFPEELIGGFYILKNADDSKKWLPPLCVRAEKDVVVYVVFRSQYRQK